MFMILGKRILETIALDPVLFRIYFGSVIKLTISTISSTELEGDAVICSGQVILASDLEFPQYRFSASFGDNPSL